VGRLAPPGPPATEWRLVDSGAVVKCPHCHRGVCGVPRDTIGMIRPLSGEISPPSFIQRCQGCGESYELKAVAKRDVAA
jgi:hypothetical protein